MSLAPNRTDGPLGKLQREGDTLKAKVDEVTAITKKWSPKSASDPDVISCHQKCVAYKIEASSLLLRANSLQKHEEPKAISNFEQKKSDEVKRLQSFQSRLDRLLNSMEDLEDGDELRNTRRSELGEKDEGHEDNNEDDEDEYSEEDDFAEDEDIDDEEDRSIYIATHAFAKQQPGDLGIKVDDIIEVIEKRKDGWWKAKNEDGEIGLVPSNYLELYDDDDDDEEYEDDVDNKKEEEEQKQITEESQLRREDLSQTGGNEKDDTEDHRTPKSSSSLNYWTFSGEWDSMDSGKELWKGVRDAVTETQKTDVTDVLAAMGALPAGFRPSTLFNKLQAGPEYNLCNAVLPKFNESQLSFADLHLDPTTTQIRKLVTRVLRNCKLVECRAIPLPGTGVEILSHHVRVCLFDGSKILSNIQTVRAKVNPVRPKMWRFSTKSTSATSGLGSSLTDGYNIVRTDATHSNVGVLFELGVTYIRNQTGERGELSCGWAHLKLFDEQGNPIPNRKYDLNLNGGTPYEQGIAVDPSILRRASSNRFRALLVKQPTLTVLMGTPTVEKRKYLELLPATIVVLSRFAELLAYYRRVLADALVRDRLAPLDADLVHSPVLATFVGSIDQSDIMDAMHNVWEEKKGPLTRADKRDKENMKNVFKSVVMETAFPLLNATTMPESKWADVQTEQARARIIEQTLQVTKQPQGVLRYLLAPPGDLQPFDISEVTFDLLHDHGRSLT
uniref:Nephrocystin-1-like n=1 Tax=Phallusia mammillata TaxID=59560 RepID=A0A6F9DLU7_9ASCI|nr:nephrocystin-1-like [Phallusia mammillata]